MINLIKLTTLGYLMIAVCFTEVTANLRRNSETFPRYSQEYPDVQKCTGGERVFGL